MALIGQGRQDWTRTDPHDSMTLVREVSVAKTGTALYGPFNIGSFTGLVGQLGTPGSPAITLSFAFYADAAATILMGSRRIIVDSTVIVAAPMLSMRALGPYVLIGAQRTDAGAAWTSSFSITATTRPTEDIFTSQDGVITVQNNLVVGAGLTTTINHDTLQDGPVSLGFDSNVVGMQIGIETFRQVATWDRLTLQDLVGTKSQTTRLVLPPYPCRSKLINTTAGNITVNYSLIRPLGGST